MVAFAFDYGRIYIARRELQSGADAAADIDLSNNTVTVVLGSEDVETNKESRWSSLR